MDTLPKPQVFLMFSVPMDDLRQPYAAAAQEHLELEPQIFLLPWPAEAFPAVGTKINLMDGHPPFEMMVVAEHEQVFDLKRGLRVYARCEPDESPDCMDQTEALKALARNGCLIYSSLKPVKDILQKAGLSIEYHR